MLYFNVLLTVDLVPMIVFRKLKFARMTRVTNIFYSFFFLFSKI